MKHLLWIGSSKRDLLEMPKNVISDIGHGLLEAQRGEDPSSGKILKGFRGGDVIELVINDRGGTFRSVYTVRFSEAIIVLHVFQKKSKSGISTPKKEIDLIHERLCRAESVYKDWKKGKDHG